MALYFIGNDIAINSFKDLPNIEKYVHFISHVSNSLTSVPLNLFDRIGRVYTSTFFAWYMVTFFGVKKDVFVPVDFGEERTVYKDGKEVTFIFIKNTPVEPNFMILFKKDSGDELFAGSCRFSEAILDGEVLRPYTISQHLTKVYFDGSHINCPTRIPSSSSVLRSIITTIKANRRKVVYISANRLGNELILRTLAKALNTRKEKKPEGLGVVSPSEDTTKNADCTIVESAQAEQQQRTKNESPGTTPTELLAPESRGVSTSGDNVSVADSYLYWGTYFFTSERPQSKDAGGAPDPGTEAVMHSSTSEDQKPDSSLNYDDNIFEKEPVSEENIEPEAPAEQTAEAPITHESGSTKIEVFETSELFGFSSPSPIHDPPKGQAAHDEAFDRVSSTSESLSQDTTSLNTVEENLLASQDKLDDVFEAQYSDSKESGKSEAPSEETKGGGPTHVEIINESQQTKDESVIPSSPPATSQLKEKSSQATPVPGNQKPNANNSDLRKDEDEFVSNEVNTKITHIDSSDSKRKDPSLDETIPMEASESLDKSMETPDKA